MIADVVISAHGQNAVSIMGRIAKPSLQFRLMLAVDVLEEGPPGNAPRGLDHLAEGWDILSGLADTITVKGQAFHGSNSSGRPPTSRYGSQPNTSALCIAMLSPFHSQYVPPRFPRTRTSPRSRMA